MRRSSLARPLTAILVAAIVSGALAGCTGVTIAGSCEPEFGPGDASTAVTATGGIDEAPDVEFPTPLIAETTERSVLVAGDGELAAAGSIVRAEFVSFDGATGASTGEGTALFSVSVAARELGESLECVAVGSRVAIVGPAPDLFPDGSGGTIVAVLDIEAIYLGKANGINQVPQDGMPTVVTAVDGTPGISSTYLPAAEKPRSATIKAGGGTAVADGDTVVFHARSWAWSAGTTNNVTLGDIDSWTRGTPYALAPTAESMGDETLAEAIVGATVGSQILVVLPDPETPSSATVYVFDILGIVADD